MIRNGWTRMAAGAITLAAHAGATAPAAAQQITEARIRELIKEAADPASRLQMPPTAQPGATGDTRPAVALTLDDAVKFALDRNLGIDATRQQLQVTKINRDISDVQLRSTITNTVSNVRNAYWDYVFAVQAVEVTKQSLDLAERLVRDNQTRVEVGTMAPIDVVQAQSQAATARQNLVAAQSTMRTAELALKRLIVGGTSDPNWSVRLDPVDRPEFTPQTFDIEAAVRRALNERTDLEIAKKNIEANDVTLKYLVDQMRPQADVSATYGLVGFGGSQYVYEPGATGVNR